MYTRRRQIFENRAFCISSHEEEKSYKLIFYITNATFNQLNTAYNGQRLWNCRDKRHKTSVPSNSKDITFISNILLPEKHMPYNWMTNKRSHLAVCAALAHMKEQNIEDAWLHNMENAPQSEAFTKLTIIPVVRKCKYTVYVECT